MDDTYYFRIEGVAGTATAEEEPRTVPITITGGEAATVEVEDLAPGEYTVTELQTRNGTTLMGSDSITLTVETGKKGEDVPLSGRGELTNNINTTQLTVNKVWSDDGQEGVDHAGDVINYTLFRIPYVIGDNDSITEYDPEEVESAAGYHKNLNYHTTPKWTDEIENLPVTGSVTLADHTIIPVQYEYYVSEDDFPGYKSHVSGGASGGTYSFTINNEPHSTFDIPTEVNVKKYWKKTDNTDDQDAHDDDSITFRLEQKKYEAEIYPVRIILINGDGTQSEFSKTIYLPKNLRLNFYPNTQNNGHRVNVSGTDSDGAYRPKTTVYINNANGGRIVTFALQNSGDKWNDTISGTNWVLEYYDTSHNESHTENEFIDEEDLQEWIEANTIKDENLIDNPHEPYDYTMKLNDDKAGTHILKHNEYAIGKTEGSQTVK